MSLVRRRAAIALPLLALCHPAIVHAQETQASKEKSVDTRALGSEEIVVTAATDPFRSKNNSTTVVESVVVDPLESPARDGSVAGLIAQLPGINIIEDYENPRYVTIRGITADYNLTTLDGVRLASVGQNGAATTGRRTNLQLLPSDFARRVDVYKTFTAEQAADQIGGAINIVTLSAFDPNQKTLFIDAYGRYNTQGGDNSNNADKSLGQVGYGISARYITRFGSDQQFGLVASARFARTPRHFDINLESASKNYYNMAGKKIAAPDPDLDWNGLAFPITNPCYCSYNDVLDSYGGALKLEYRSSDDALQISIMGYNYATTQDYNANANYIYLTPPATQIESVIGYSWPVNYFLNDYWEDNIKYENRGVLGNASYDFNSNTKLIWRTALSSETYSNYRQAVSSRGTPTKKPTFNFTLGEDSRTEFNSLSDPAVIYSTPYRVTSQYEIDADARQRVFDTRLDLMHNVDREARGLGFVVGGEFSRMKHDNDTNRTNYQITPTIDNSDVIYDPDYIPYGSAVSLPRLDYNRYREQYWDRLQVNEATSRDNSISADFGYYEDLKSAYLSAHYTLPTTRIIAGVRYDAASYHTNSPVTTNGDPTGEFTSVKGDYDHWLPSVSVVQRFGQQGDTVLRASFSKTLTRPAPAQIAQGISTGCQVDDPTECTVSRGNPDLKPRQSRNIDFSIEHYYNEGRGMLELTYFHKKIKDDIFTLREVRVEDGISTTYTQPMNGTGSALQGVEFAWVQRGIPVGISNHRIDLSMNATRLWGYLNFQTPTDVVHIDGMGYQPKWIVNAAATYRIPAIGGGIRANFSRRGRNLTGYGANPNTFSYRDAITTVNLAAWHKVTKNLTFKYEWTNLLNDHPSLSGVQGVNVWTTSYKFGSAALFHAVASF